MDEHRNQPPGHRGLRLGSMPTSSVVIASRRDRAALEALLGTLVPSCAARGIEVVVARNCAAEEYRGLADAWPAVLFMPAQDNATVRQLRAVGLSAAEGDIVTLVDDDHVVDPRWLEELPPHPVPAGTPNA